MNGYRKKYIVLFFMVCSLNLANFSYGRMNFGIVEAAKNKIAEIKAEKESNIQNQLPRISSLEISGENYGIGGKLNVVCNAYSNSQDQMTYHWSCSGGAIEGQEKSVRWQLPEIAGTFTISCFVSTNQGSTQTLSRSVNIDYLDVYPTQFAPCYPDYSEHIKDTNPLIHIVAYAFSGGSGLVRPGLVTVELELQKGSTTTAVPIKNLKVAMDRVTLSPLNQLEDGYYKVKISTLKSDGYSFQQREEYGFYVDTTGPQITSNFSKVTWDPDVDAQFYVNYFISDEISFAFINANYLIKDRNTGVIVYQESYEYSISGGGKLWRWNFITSSGTKITQGQYEFEITIDDLAGNTGKLKREFVIQ